MTRDLRRQYGKEYGILRADSGTAALEALEELAAREPFLLEERGDREDELGWISVSRTDS